MFIRVSLANLSHLEESYNSPWKLLQAYLGSTASSVLPNSKLRPVRETFWWVLLDEFFGRHGIAPVHFVLHIISFVQKLTVIDGKSCTVVECQWNCGIEADACGRCSRPCVLKNHRHKNGFQSKRPWHLAEKETPKLRLLLKKRGATLNL